MLLLYTVFRFFYNFQTLLRSFWLLSATQIKSKIVKLQDFYLQILIKQLLNPSKVVKKHIELGVPEKTARGSIILPYSKTSELKNSKEKIALLHEAESDIKVRNEILGSYKEIISDIPRRSLFSNKLLRLIFRFSWKASAIFLIYIIWRIISSAYLTNAFEILTFYRSFINMSTSTINANTLSFQYFSPNSNLTFVDLEFLKNRDRSISNFYEFMESIRSKRMASFVSAVNNNVESIIFSPGFSPQIDLTPVVPLKLSFSYLRNPYPIGQSFRSYLNATFINELEANITHITSMGFKTSFLTHMNLNDFMLVYYKKIKNYEDTFSHIERDLNILILYLSNTFAIVSEEIDSAFDSYSVGNFIREILFMFFYVLLFVWFFVSQYRIYADEVPTKIHCCKNILNLFSMREFRENKILEQYFIEELQNSLKE